MGTAGVDWYYTCNSRPALIVLHKPVFAPAGAKNVVGRKQIERLKSGCILANMGHSNQEIDLDSFREFHREKIRKNVTRILLPNNKRIFLLADVSL